MNITFNGYIERLMELDSLYLNIQKVSGFTVEQLLDMFIDGYTMDAPESESKGTVFWPYKYNPGFRHERNTSWLDYAMRKKEAHTVQVSYNGFTGELVKLERKPNTKTYHGYIYDLSICDSEKEVTHSFTGVKLEDVKFLGGAVSFGG